jgi:hypothetical protein
LAVAAVVGMLVGVAAALGANPPAVLPTTFPADRPSLQADLDLAQRIIDDPASPCRGSTWRRSSSSRPGSVVCAD